MDTRTRTTAGWVVAAVGVIVVLIGVLADQIGLGANDSTDLGGKQLAAVIVGLVIAVVGLATALWPKQSKERETAGTT